MGRDQDSLNVPALWRWAGCFVKEGRMKERWRGGRRRAIFSNEITENTL